MKAILSLLCAIGVGSMFESDRKIFEFNPDFDIIGTLPLEVAIIIFRLLDPKSLVRVITVRRSWLRIIMSDRILGQRVREQLQEKRNQIKELVMWKPATSIGSGKDRVYSQVNIGRPTVLRQQRVIEMPVRNTRTKGQKRKLREAENPAPKKSAISRVYLR